MKYGMRERISGGIILVAIAVILVLFFCGRPGHHDEKAAVPDVSFNQQPVNNGVANDPSHAVPMEDSAVAPNAVAPGIDHSSTDVAVPNTHQQNGSAVVNPLPAQPNPTPAVSQPQPTPVASSAVQPAPVVPASHVQSAPQRPAPAARPTPAAPAPSKLVAAPQPVHKPAATDTKPSKLASSDPIITASQHSNAHPAVAPATKPAPAPAVSTLVPTEGWSVQAGSFGNVDNAQRLIQRLSQSGFKAYMLKRDPNAVVLVGPFSTSQAAEEARTQMQQRAGTNGLVVRNGKH